MTPPPATSQPRGRPAAPAVTAAQIERAASGELTLRF
jgi:hypothetical protein